MSAAQCPVCKEFFSHDSHIVAPQCGHVFHLICLETWAQAKATCPQCRVPVRRNQQMKRIYIDFANLDTSISSNQKAQIEADENSLKVRELRSKMTELEKKLTSLSSELATVSMLFEEAQKKYGEEKSKSLELHAASCFRAQVQYYKKDLKSMTDKIRAAEVVQKKFASMKKLEDLLYDEDVDNLAVLDEGGDQENAKFVRILRRELTTSRADRRTAQLEMNRLHRDLLVSKSKLAESNRQMETLTLRLQELGRENARLLATTDAPDSSIASSVSCRPKVQDKTPSVVEVPRSTLSEAFSRSVSTSVLSAPKRRCSLDTSLSDPGPLNSSEQDMFAMSVKLNSTPSKQCSPSILIKSPKLDLLVTPSPLSKKKSNTQGKFRPASNPFGNHFHDYNIMRRQRQQHSTFSPSVYNGLGGRIRPFNSGPSLPRLSLLPDHRKNKSSTSAPLGKRTQNAEIPKLDGFVVKAKR